jgi:hypothetical protein
MFAIRMNTVIPALTFVARHLLFVVFAMFVGCILWIVAYFLLLAIAVVGDQGIGGPLALPAGLIAVIASCIFIGWGVFAPASAIGAIFCGLLKLPRLAAIPIVTVAAFVLSYLIYWGYIELATTHFMPSVWTILKNFGIFLSVPLGIYWWLTEGPGALFDSFRRWIRKHRQNQIIREQDDVGHPSTRIESK